MRRAARLLSVVALWIGSPLSSLATEDAPEPDSLARYLESLGRAGEGSFSPITLEVPVIADSTVDSLVARYARDPGAVERGNRGRRSFSIAPQMGALRYTRVEGLRAMPGVSLSTPLPAAPRLSAAVGYGTSSEDWTWKTGLRLESLPFAPRGSLSGSYRRDVVRYGSGGMVGNSFTAILAGEDYDDYYRAEGWELEMSASPGPARLAAGTRADEHRSASVSARPPLFNRSEGFRANPPIDEGSLRLIFLHAGIGRGEGRISADLEGAWADAAIGSDFSYASGRGEVRGVLSLRGGDETIVRFTGGGVGDGAPFQALHHLGGFRTLRGYEVNEWAARQFLHLSVDHHLGIDFTRGIPGLRWLRLQAVPFADAAVMRRDASDPGGGTARRDDTRLAAGLGLQRDLLRLPDAPGWVRVDIARRLDRGERAMSYRITLAGRR